MMCSIFCLLTSMDLILVQNCCLLYLNSKNINNLKNLFWKKKLEI